MLLEDAREGDDPQPTHHTVAQVSQGWDVVAEQDRKCARFELELVLEFTLAGQSLRFADLFERTIGKFRAGLDIIVDVQMLAEQIANRELIFFKVIDTAGVDLAGAD